MNRCHLPASGLTAWLDRRATSRLATGLAALLLLPALAACGGGGGGDPAPPQGTTPPLISSFSPTAGAVGTQVTVSGLLFAETVAGNTVRFNGLTATVLSASATSLVVQVPAGATTGRLQVTTAGGSATTSTDFTVLTGLGAAWTTRLAGPRDRPTGLAWTGTRHVTVGGSVQVSMDARVWNVVNEASPSDDVAWDGGLLVAVGSSFWVSTSADGLTWTTRTLPSGSQRLNAAARSPALWAAVGRSGSIQTSPDGVTWTTRVSGTAKDLVGVTWAGSRFVAVGWDGAVVTSSDGLAWTTQPAPTTDSFTAVGASPSLIVASTYPSSGSPSALLTSPDGVAWTPGPPGISSFNRLVQAGGRFVGVGFYSAGTSPDGLAWTVASDVPGIPEALVHTGAGYVATGSDRNGVGAAFTSSDGLAWSLVAADHDLVTLARRPSDGLLLAVGSDTARTSTDRGATWRLSWLTPSLSANYPFLDVVWSPAASAFIALVQVAANHYAYGSADGTSWTELGYVPCSGALAISDAGLLLATGSSLTGSCVATSPDGVTWTRGTAPAGPQLRKAHWLSGQFVAVGNSGALATSPDGATWTPRTSGVTASLQGAAASPSALVVVGDGGTVLTSPDGGVTWTARVSGTTSGLRRVLWTGTEFLAVGSSGRLLRSPDGATWTTQPTPYGTSPNAFSLRDLAWLPAGGGAPGRLVLVGSNGLIATSDAP